MERVRDRRRAGRFPLELEAYVREESRLIEEACENVQIRNISSSGALFSSGAAWEKGQPVSILIKLGKKLDPPYNYDLNLKGKIVRRSNGFDDDEVRYAVEFNTRWKTVNRTGT